jgi:hypothetical protein
MLSTQFEGAPAASQTPRVASLVGTTQQALQDGVRRFGAWRQSLPVNWMP